MEKLSFLNPEFFWLLLLIPAAAAWLYLKRNQQTATLKISSTAGFTGSKSFFVRLYPFLGVFRLLALTALIVAMARPRTVDISNKNILMPRWQEAPEAWAPPPCSSGRLLWPTPCGLHRQVRRHAS